MKNLVVCLDGTWNSETDDSELTNIGKIARLIEPKPADGPPQRVYYDSGVGTAGLVDRYTGGILGIGLSGNVQEAYRFLSQFYKPGDGIFVFGFSRGAYTARSLCGFMAASGLLRRETCTQENMELAWNYYRTPPNKRYPSENARLAELTNPGLRVRFLGVFDTVGALGIPRRSLNWIGRHRFEFHDTDLSSIVDHSCHAIAIDEKRIEFESAVWVEPRHRGYETVEQVWFPGVHSNVGGGYDDTGISDLTLKWMMQRATFHCPELALRGDMPIGDGDERGTIYESRSALYWRSKRTPLMRLIRRCEVTPPGGFIASKCPPHSRPIGEYVHWSAMKRWQATARGPADKRYAPPNLLAALEKVKGGEIPVIDPDGHAKPWAVVRKAL